MKASSSQFAASGKPSGTRLVATGAMQTPSQLVRKQLTGNSILDELHQKPRIVQFLNLADYSINTESYVSIDEPLFEAIPPLIQFTDYEPLQIKEKTFKLRNKDKFSRRVKIIQPDSRLFQVLPANDDKNKGDGQGKKVAAGMETKFIVRFSPEAKIDYKYELMVVTEREKFIVPIVAVGKRAMIDFPDVLDFGNCPVKYYTEKPVIIRNLGEKTTKWSLELPSGFSTSQKQGVLECGKNEQIIVKFYPTEAKLYKTVGKLEYDKLQAFVEIVGSGQLSNVYLSKTFIPMEESYIGLQTQQTLQIINKSNVKVDFEWRAFSSEKEEKPKKELLRQQLNEQEAEQLMLLREMVESQKTDQNQHDFEDSSDEEKDPKANLQKRQKKAELALSRKYRTIRKAIEDDLFLFQDHIFRIEPQVGEIWPNSEITVTVTFMPTQANHYECLAYCNISCAEERLPLKLKGEGIGPKAYLTQQEINFGDVFVNQPIKQTIQIENRGEIQCHFNLIKQDRAFARMFDFSIEEKTLDVGENASIDIRFKSSIPGEFKQKFRWQLQGSQKNLEMTFLGHVIAPTFEFVDPNDPNRSKPQINFGKVSYDFDYKEKIILKNTSEVAFTFTLKIQNDGKVSQSEFRISPQTDTIQQKCEKEIEISFVPKSIKKYETVMTIDIEGVGNDMLSVPIRAECQVPSVEVSPVEKLEFGEAFLNYPETRIVTLKNNSDLKAKFHVLPQSEESKILARYTVSPQTDVIAERDSKEVQVTLVTIKRGEITLPLHINIVGTNNSQPNVLNICATSIGPPVKVTPQELDFGQVEVLKDYSLKVTIVNASKIPAEFHAFTKQKVSIFKPMIKHAILKPEEKLQVEVICNADDASKFSDILHFVVRDGNDRDVVLKARGTGSTIYCVENLDYLNFQTIYTFKTVVKEIFIQNRGRKSQKISWQKSKLQKKKKDDEDKQEEEAVFVIEPESETIPPKYGRNFKFIAHSSKKGKISEQFQLMSQIGTERKSNILKTMTIEGQFIQPNLVFSDKKLNFKYKWVKDVPFAPIPKTIEMTSGSALPLNFSLKVIPPYFVDQENIVLQPGKSAKVRVDFDPSFKSDRVSGVLNGKMTIVHSDHPHRETVDLIGQVCFPNVKLASEMINFGSILNDTTKKITIGMQNISEMALNYEWTFVEEEVIGVGAGSLNSTHSLGGGPQSIPINEIFDILPLSGYLEPGQVEDVEFVYNALGGMNFRATAVCHIDGGPNYEVKLEGDSSLINARIAEKEIDLGEQRFCEWVTRELLLENTGKVTFEYKVSLASIKRKGFIEVTPLSGKIVGGEKQRLTVKVCPVMPDAFKEQFTVQMGYFEPETIVVKGIGVYPSIVANFPRIENPEFDKKLKEEVDKYSKEYEVYAKRVAQLSQKDKALLKTKKEMKTVQSHKMEVEKELDRQAYCELIKKEVADGKSEAKLYEGIFLTTWICDFGNVIVGTTQKKQVKIKNVGGLPLDMIFDTKQSKLAGYTIAPEKISKMMPSDEVVVAVTLTTKKTMKFGKSKLSVPVEVKNGAQYKMDLITNLTIPDITIEGNPENAVDFGKVLCGQRKTVFLRLLNEKEIPCEWSLNLRDGLTADKKEEVKFVLNPNSGKIASGGFQIVEVSFAPSAEKEYQFKFPIKIVDNSRVLTLDLKGVGASIVLDVLPQKIKIGPVLPYSAFEYEVLEIHNPTNYPTELISLDFDKKFKDDEETIAAYADTEDQDKKDQEVIYLPVREPGSGVWPQVVKAVEKKKKKTELQKKLETEGDKLSPEEKARITKQLDELNVVEQVVDYPRKVDSEVMLHVAILGPTKSGRTSVAQALKREQKRAIVNINQLLEWNLSSGTPAAAKATEFLQERKKEYELALQERDKLFKKAGKKAKEVEEKLGSANEHLYQVLPENVLVDLLKERMKHPECAAGCIFDNITGKNILTETAAVKVIMKAIGTEALLVVTLDGKVANKEPEKKEEPPQPPPVAEVKKQEAPPAQTSKKIPASTRKSLPPSKKEEKPVQPVIVEKKEENVYFTINDPTPEQKAAYEDRKTEILRYIKNEHTKEFVITLFKDPVFEEAKKDEKPVKGGKGAPVQEKPVEVQVPKDPTLFDGHRDAASMPIYQNLFDQRQAAVSTVPAPVYKDPAKEPVPEPIFHEAIGKQSSKSFESKILSEFSIYTPKDPFRKEQKKEDKKKPQKKASTRDSKLNPLQQTITEKSPPFKLEDLVKEQSRWIIPPNTVLTLLVRFFSKVVGGFESTLTFENSFGLRKTVCPVSAKSDFPLISTIPKNLYWTVKKARPANVPDSYISKAFIQSESLYEFGPLLIGKSADKKNDKEILNVNSTTFRLSNQGSYPAELQFALMSSIVEGNSEYKKGIFTISEEKMNLAVNDPPKEIRVWALPDAPQKFRDELIVMIRNNPSPVIIPVQCQGAKPQIDIIEGSPLKFTRILLKQTIKKQLKLKNNGSIPIKFKLTGTEALPEEFSVDKKEGELKPTEEVTVEVTFKAIKQQKFTQKITLIAEDIENMNIKNEPKEIPIEAEAFDISVDLKFPTSDSTQNMLDFGAIRVGDFQDKTFTVKNIGLYNVKFAFVMKKKMFKECFRIEPNEVELEPNGIKQILVRCTSNKELKLKTNNSTTDINMEVLEGKTLEIHKSVPINVAVNAVFSKYSVIPLKNINFGPIQFNETKTRTFEIKNEGLFEFNYTLFDFNNEEFRKELQSSLEKEKAAKLEALNTLPVGGAVDPKKGKKQAKEVKKEPAGKKGKGGKGEPEGQLKIGQWAINPPQGTVAPDSSATVEVTFSGSGQKLYEQKLGLDIQNRDPEDEPKGILYELVAESCIPGINTEDFETIFEEQVVMASQQSGASTANMINSNVFYVEEKVFHFGTLVPSKIPDGIVEKFKIQNNNKVACTIKFDTRKKTPTSVQQFAFEVEPKQAKIPPHEHCYVNVTFKPTIMALYSGMFQAVVENGQQNPKTHKLTFDLRGEGALPTIKLEKPKEYFDERTVLVKFNKTRVGKATTQQICLKNDGVIPATVKWELPATDSFRFLDSTNITINPKGSATFNVEFKPKDVGAKTWDVNAQTLLNQFEVTRFKIQGEGLYEQVLFENLPDDQEDKVNFGDCVIDKERRINFSIKNNSPSVVKFQWPFHDDFTFVPKVGHIEPKGNKLITLVFKSAKTITHKELALACQTNQIKQNTAEFIDWDDSQSVTKYITKTEFEWLERKKEEQKRKREEEAEAAKKGGKKEAKKAGKVQEKKQEKPPVPPPGEEADIEIQDPIPEPENTPVEKTDRTITLKCSAVADYTRYEVESKAINFLATMMYTSRVHKFMLKNTSLINLRYLCKIVSAETGKIDAGYYSLGNHSGNIAPGCDEMFTLKFSPTEVEDSNSRLLVISIDNLDPHAEKLIIELDGDTERPICHFQLPPSKYREKKPDLEAKYSTIEFESLGTKVKNSKRFYVVNPTSMAYEYEWKKLDDEKTPNAGFFRCPTSKGTILSGKKAEIIFEYTPDVVGTHESYWVFEIPSERIVQHFLAVGTVVEPNVFFDSGKINFGPLLIGGKNKEVVNLKNLQDVPIPFSFDRESIKGEPQSGDSLQIEPLSGVIPAQGESKIEITFAPKVQKEFNYNLSCAVKRKSRAVCINVKGIGYVLSHSVYHGTGGAPLQASNRHEVSFGNLFVNEKRSKTLTIENNGDFNFDFAIKKGGSFSFLKFSNEFGTVRKNQKFTVDIQFAPTEEFTFGQNSTLSLSIVSGPTYVFVLKGSAKKPGVDFSFFSYDFGPCFVLKQPLPVTTYLEIRNRESTAMSIQPLYEKNAFLDVRIASGQVVLPLRSEPAKDKKATQSLQTNVLKVPIVFTPRDCIKYNETVSFDINGLNRIDVEIKGEGVPFKLEVEKTENQNIDFGITKVGEQSSRVVSIVNLSKKKIDITFDTDSQLEEFKKLFLEVSPSGQLSINPKERKEIELTFHPKTRIHSFKCDLNYKIVQNQEKRKLLSIQTAAHGVELKLMEETIGFGTVVMNSKVSKIVQLANLGDIGTRYDWDTTFCEKFFSIQPKKGYLPAHEDLNFQITFHPNVPNHDINFKIKCNIEGADPLFMNLLGKCIDQPKQNVQELKFDCMVRTSKSQKIQLKNPSAKPWKIKAIVSSTNDKSYFQGKEFVEVPASGTADYEVVYTPLTMTASPDQPDIKEESHEGTLFFPIPDGSAVLYKLVGKSLPPQPLQTFDMQLKAKKNGFQMIPVKNWLKAGQRFNVVWKFDTEDKTIFVNAANTFDVAGDATKDYKLSVYALKACQAKLEIVFKNPTTGEFLSYKINITVQPPDAMQRIDLQSVVRESVTKLITIENPLANQVEIKKEMLTVDSEVVLLQPNSFVIPPKSEFGFEVVYRPLLAKEDNAKITLKSPELGEFIYPLKLVGSPTTLQRTLAFKTNLGNDITQTFKFIHYGKKATVYNCRVEKIGQKVPVNVDPKAKAPVPTSDFTCETATVNAAGTDNFEGIEIGVNVKFEPSGLSESSSQLIVSSNDGGEYVCLLNGLTTPPQPKGPFKMAGAKPPPIDFKNPFFDAYEFTVRIDNPAFTSGVKSPVKIDGKKTLSINIAYKAVPGYSNSGRLIISAGDMPAWVFYLQGE